MRPLTDEERAQVVLWYNRYKSLRRVRTEFRKIYNRRPPSVRTILHWAQRFANDGTVSSARRRPRKTTNEIDYAIVGAFEVNPKMGVRQAARLFSVDPNIIRRVLRRNFLRSGGEEKSTKDAQLMTAAVNSKGAPTRTSTIGELVRQLKIMPPQSRHGKRLFYCSHCLYTTQFQSCMKAHKRKHEKDLEAEEDCPAKAQTCRSCECEFTDRKMYMIHMREHKLEKTERQSQKWEMKRLKLKKELKEPLKRKENQQVVRVRCPTIGKQSNAEVFCIPLNDLPFSCGDCTASFRDKTSLIKHERSHGAAKPFECDLCPASFVRLKNLSYHERAHHKKLACSTCGEQFSGEKEYVTHVKAHHRKALFGCYMCRAIFSERSAFLYHMSQHVMSCVSESDIIGHSTVMTLEGTMKASLGKTVEKPTKVGNKRAVPAQGATAQQPVQPAQEVIRKTLIGSVVEVIAEPSREPAVEEAPVMESVKVVMEEQVEPDEGATKLFRVGILKDHTYVRAKSKLTREQQ